MRLGSAAAACPLSAGGATFHHPRTLHYTAPNTTDVPRLAYPIDRHTEGFYLLAELQAEPEAMKELDRVLALLDEVVRFKVVVRSAA